MSYQRGARDTIRAGYRRMIRFGNLRVWTPSGPTTFVRRAGVRYVGPATKE